MRACSYIFSSTEKNRTWQSHVRTILLIFELETDCILYSRLHEKKQAKKERRRALFVPILYSHSFNIFL